VNPDSGDLVGTRTAAGVFSLLAVGAASAPPLPAPYLFTYGGIPHAEPPFAQLEHAVTAALRATPAELAAWTELLGVGVESYVMDHRAVRFSSAPPRARALAHTHTHRRAR
jgi:hypothetical protein